MTFSYGSMLAQLKKEMLNEDSGASTHLIELLTSIRSDELEKQLLDESEEYQNCIKEEENSEEEVKRKLSSKEWKFLSLLMIFTHFVESSNSSLVMAL